jgi:acetyl esterase/lipase
VIAAGGSYGHQLGLAHEGFEVARWLAAHGVTAVVLRYRVGGASGYDHADFLADGQRAVRTVRAEAASLGVDPDRIGMIGFSAGGHLASWVATRCAEDLGDTQASDPVQRASCRVAFSVLVYPVITLDDPYAHRRSRNNLVGSRRRPPTELARRLSTDTLVTPATPPAFLVHSRRDRKVDAHNSVLFYRALVDRGVPAELWLAEDGDHGVGLAMDRPNMPQMAAWPQRCLRWLEDLDVLPRAIPQWTSASHGDDAVAIGSASAPRSAP